MTKGQLVVISGPSGVGKSTVIQTVTQHMEQKPFFSVSATTRQQRPGEVDHVNYHFVTDEAFRRMIEEHAFLEYAQYAKHFYGTPVAPIQAQLDAGRDVFLDIEVQGALQVRQNHPEAIMIFIAAPSFGELEQRLRGRGDTSEEAMQLRLQTARREYEQGLQYDYVVINDHVGRCADKILSILTAEKCRLKHNRNILKEALSYVISLNA